MTNVQKCNNISANLFATHFPPIPQHHMIAFHHHVYLNTLIKHENGWNNLKRSVIQGDNRRPRRERRAEPHRQKELRCRSNAGAAASTAAPASSYGPGKSEMWYAPLRNRAIGFQLELFFGQLWIWPMCFFFRMTNSTAIGGDGAVFNTFNISPPPPLPPTNRDWIQLILNNFIAIFDRKVNVKRNYHTFMNHDTVYLIQIIYSKKKFLKVVKPFLKVVNNWGTVLLPPCGASPSQRRLWRRRSRPWCRTASARKTRCPKVRTCRRLSRSQALQNHPAKGLLCNSLHFSVSLGNIGW